MITKQFKQQVELEYSKLPPQDIAFEEAVLGIMISEQDWLIVLMSKLKEEVFYKPCHKVIFRAIETLFKQNKPVDLLSVINCLKQTGELDTIGGICYVTDLTGKVSSGNNSEYYTQRLCEIASIREAISVGHELTRLGFEKGTDSEELINNGISSLEGILSKYNPIVQDNKEETVERIVIDTIAVSKGEKKTAGIPSNIHNLNRVVFGWQKKHLIILAARPGMGKTAFILCEILGMAVAGVPVAVFSLEMGAEELWLRLIIIKSQIDNYRIKKGEMDEQEMESFRRAADFVVKLPIYIIDTAGMTITQVRTEAKILKKKYSIELIALDYLQLMSGDRKSGGNREQEISSISRGLKCLAKELDVPVIALSQLSRSCETRGDKRPILSDLRESGAIEQDADLVMFLWRPGYYNKDGVSDTSFNNDFKPGETEINVAKNRHGQITTVSALFEESTMTFKNPEPEFLSAPIVEDFYAGMHRTEPQDKPF